MIYRAVVLDERLARVGIAVVGVDAAARGGRVALDHRHVRLPELAEALPGQVHEKLAVHILQGDHGAVERRVVPGEAVEQCEGYDFLGGS